MTFAEPLWFLLLLVLPVLGIGVALAARHRGRQWSAFMAPRLRARLLQRAPRIHHWIALACALLALTLLIFALARPRSARGHDREAILGRNIMFVLDLSRSMMVQDLKPDRLGQAKALAYELLEALPDDRIGLIGFAGTPYMFAPLTVDHNAVRQTIAQIDPDWIPTGGSNLEDGLELAIEKLIETGTRQNALILMSDGEEHEGRITDLAQRARDAGIEVITIGFGTPLGDIVPDPGRIDGRFRDINGEEVISRLEPDPLQRLAQVTGGRFAIATSGADIPAMVNAAVADLERVRITSGERTVLDEHFQWFLLPAIACMVAAVIALTRWRGIGPARRAAAPAGAATAAVLLAWTGSTGPLRAVTLGEARQALDEERFEDAAAGFAELAERHPDEEKAFRYHLAEGQAAYRIQDWSTARRAFSDALRSRDPEVRRAAHHGLGNTLFEIGWARLSGGPAYPDPGSPEQTGGAGPDAFDRISDALLDEGGEAPNAPEADAPLAGFEEMLKRRLAEWLREPDSEGGESRGSERFHAVVSDWIDAVQHYDSAVDFEPAAHNRKLTVAHLEKLRELLAQIQDSAEQLQAVPQTGPGQPQPREGEQGEEPQDGSDGDDPQDGENGQPGEEPGEGGDDQDGSGDNEGEPQDDGDGGDQEDLEPRPGESPEEAARRILRENADLQKGALSPGRLQFRRPEKDW